MFFFAKKRRDDATKTRNNPRQELAEDYKCTKVFFLKKKMNLPQQSKANLANHATTYYCSDQKLTPSFVWTPIFSGNLS
jgi:hypothetical protein